MVNFTCNATLEDMHIIGEVPIVGNFTFHQLALVVGGGTAAISVLLSVFLMFMHGLHYTKPYEQKHIIRIIFMIPVYSTASFLSIWFYRHAIYFTLISACYEAFAIASFFALLCSYVAPTLHDQKEFFRSLHPIKPWLWPVNWQAKCCGGQRGIWRTPKSGLTWFNVIWFGIYQYCFVRVAMTIVAVVTQYFDVYCESSAYPWFSHIWVLVIEASAVTVAMYMVIQFYLQLRKDLVSHGPFLKVLSIKLVIFLSFWQSSIISVLLSSTVNIIHPTKTIEYPDLAVGIPNLLLCVEMALFAVLHIFAYPYKPYKPGGLRRSYPVSGDDHGINDIGLNQGGFMGLLAFLDALNPWDLIKAFGRGMRWIFVGRRHRKEDISYAAGSSLPLDPQAADTAYKSSGGTPPPNPNLPIAEQFRRSRFSPLQQQYDEGAGLMQHAQGDPMTASAASRAPSPHSPSPPYPITTTTTVAGQGFQAVAQAYSEGDIGVAVSDSPVSPWSSAPRPGAVAAPQQPHVVASPMAMHDLMWGPHAGVPPPPRNIASQHGEVHRRTESRYHTYDGSTMGGVEEEGGGVGGRERR